MYEVGLDNLQVTLYVLPNRGVGLYPCLTPTDYALAMELFYMVKFRPSVNQSLVPGSTYPGNNESRILLSESMGTEVHVYLGNHRIYNIRSQQRLSGIMTGNPSTLGQLKNRKNTTAIGGVLYPTAY